MNLNSPILGTPSAQGRLKDAKPVAVLDIGSNSVRLVAYERHARALTPLYNEKSSCALGRGVTGSGVIAKSNYDRALTAAKRYALVAKLMGISKTYVLATSAVREAENGPQFASDVSKIMGADVRVLSGPEEAHFAALGVVAGIPDFKGVVGDLGGGSLELSVVSEGHDSPGETLALGVIRTQDDSAQDLKKAIEITRERIDASGILSAQPGGRFCAIGGTWRALAKLHQRLNKYPLHMVQGYEVDANEIVALCDSIVGAAGKDDDYPNSELVSGSRRNLVPYGAVVLREVIRLGQFETVSFSALGVREGFLYGHLAASEQQVDPLTQGAEEMSLLRSRSPQHAGDLEEFTAQYLGAANIIETPADRRLRNAVCLLSDIGWRGHPDYRGTQSVDLVAYGALTGIDHPGRAFMAEVLAFRYMGPRHSSVSQDLLELAGEKLNQRARLIGALFRVAFPMSAGMPGVLLRTKFEVEGDRLTLCLPRDLEFLGGEHLANRLGQLAAAAGHVRSELRIG